MFAIALNPGFVMLAGALIALAAPISVRASLMVAAGLGALALLMAPDFGRYAAFAQIGLQMVPLRLDALNQVIGLAFISVAVLTAIYASGRDNRLEDAAILLLAGAATSALFVGDLVSFVAALELAGFAAAWIVFSAGGAAAQAAGVRLLVWQGLEGLLLLAGVAFQLSDGLRNDFTAMDARSVGGALFLAGLAIRVGAPLAHVWLKDVTPRASPVGAVALIVYPALLGVYGLARAFPSEPALIYAGIGMIVVGAAYACAEDDLRRSAAYSMTAQIGVALIAIGVGTPVALAGASAHVFTLALAYALLLMALGLLAQRFGGASASRLAGSGRAAPLATAFLLIGGLAAAAAPGFAPYASYAVILEAARASAMPWLTLALMGAMAFAIAHTAMRPALAALARREGRAPAAVPAFTMLLAMAVTAFVLIVVGVAPSWLYRLTPPAPLAFDPFAGARLAPHLSLVGAAAAGWVLLRFVAIAPGERPRRLLDLDALYRGPLAGAGRWLGVVLLRLYGAWRALSAAASARAAAAFASFARAGDQPYRDSFGGAIVLLGLAALLSLGFLAYS